MPITQFLEGETFDAETHRIMGVAFEMVLVALGLPDDDGSVNKIIAKRVVALAKAGEHNPDRLCEKALNGIARTPLTWQIALNHWTKSASA
jgi:hypothetical protein